MNFISEFFQKDIPAVFTSGKLRVEVSRLKNELSELESRKKEQMNKLGEAAWNKQIKDDGYKNLYEQLDELDNSSQRIKQELDNLQANLNQLTEMQKSCQADFDSQAKGIRDQRLEAQAKLNEIKKNQTELQQSIDKKAAWINQGKGNIKNLTAQLSQLEVSTLPDKAERIASLQGTITSLQTKIADYSSQIEELKPQLETNKSEQEPFQNEIAGYDQLLSLLQDKNQEELAKIRGQVSGVNKNILEANEQKNGLQNRINHLRSELGKEVNKIRPVSVDLADAYNTMDSIQNKINKVNDQINIAQAKINSLGTKSIQRVGITAGILIIILLCFVVFLGGGIYLATTVLKPNPIADIRLAESWYLEECYLSYSDESYIDISVWENRRRDEVAQVTVKVSLIGSQDLVLASETTNLNIPPRGKYITLTALDPRGNLVTDVQHEVTSVSYTKTNFSVQNISTTSNFELSSYSESINLVVGITNNSDFEFKISNDGSLALVLNKNNEIVDLLFGITDTNSIKRNSTMQITFESILTDWLGCLQSDYSDEQVTYWYFIPLTPTTSSEVIYTISDTVVRSP